MLKNHVLDRRLSEAEASAVCSVLVTSLGGSYSRLLGIKLAGMESEEVFKWFVAAVLLGSPLRAGNVLAAYRALESSQLLEPRRLAALDDSVLMDVFLAAGITGYARRIATTLRLAIESLVLDYDADINRLHFFAEDATDLVRRLRRLGRGVPRRAVDLFLREMRGVWEKALPGGSVVTVEAARCLGIIGSTGARSDAIEELRGTWEHACQPGRTYADLEVALARLGENYCQTRNCASCPMRKLCVSRLDSVKA